MSFFRHILAVQTRAPRTRKFWRFAVPLIVCFVLLKTDTAAQYRFDRWTTDEGLPQNSVYSIQQTADGYLWLTTLDGLVRFDGVKFTVFSKAAWPSLPSNRFVKLLAGDADTIFAGTDEVGLVRRQNGEFRAFSVADGLPANGIHDLQSDADGSVLITTHGGIARLSRDGAVTVEREQSYRDFRVYLAPSGARWELDANGLRKIKDAQTTNFELPFSVKPDGYELGFVAMFEDRDGALWLPYEGRIFKYKNDGSPTVFSRAENVPASAVRSIAQDRAGNVWFGTEKDGACRLSENRFECFGTANGLSSSFIHDIFLDREKNLWFGTNEGGIDRLTDRVVSPLSVRDGLVEKNVFPLLETRPGDVWIGMFGGLSHYENGKITNYTKREGLLYDVVQSLFQDDTGRLWIGSVGGVEYFENGKFVDFTRQLNLKVGETDFWDIHRDRRGTLWFATRAGLVKVADGATTRLTTADGLPHNNVKIIHEARGGELWLGTDDGLAKITGNSIAILDGFAGKSVRTIYEDNDGTIWIGTYEGGLTRLKDGAMTNYTTADGLFSNGVFAIIEDQRGNFWMSSNQGIYRVARRELDDFADGKTPKITSTAFGKSDGMLNAECNGGRQPSGFRASDGRLWFPTQDGAAIINPESVPLNPNPPPVVIESVKIDNSSLDASALAKDAPITLSPDQNNLEIAYTGLSFIKPEQIRFRYRIENLDATWTEAGTRRTAYFSRLPPGEFTFRVVAANSDNVWNEQGALIRIVVLPPFYRTWWFTLLTVFGLATAGVLFYRFRVAQLERKHALETAFSRRLIDSQERERKRFASEMHDGLGQSFVIIKNRARLSLKQIDDQDAIVDHLEQISETASLALEETREIAFNLRPHLLDRLGLTKTIESMLDKVSGASGIAFEVRLDRIDDLLDKDSEILLYRIVQETVSNVVKHSGADTATVTVEQNAAQIKVQIADNGRGFEPEATNKVSGGGFGLVGISERTRLLNGRMRVESATGKGTTVIVEIDLRK